MVHALHARKLERLYLEICKRLGDQSTRRRLVQCLAKGLRGQGKCQALSFAAGKLNDRDLVVWLLQKMPKWTGPQLRDYALTSAVQCGNMELVRMLLGR
jgi:hypothetical protein